MYCGTPRKRSALDAPHKCAAFHRLSNTVAHQLLPLLYHPTLRYSSTLLPHTCVARLTASMSSCPSARDTLELTRTVLYRDAILEVNDNELIIDKQRLLRFPWTSPAVIRIKDIERIERAGGGCLPLVANSGAINLLLRGGAGCRVLRPEKPADAYQALLSALDE